MNENYCFSERNIINKSIKHVQSNVATKEERLLVKLYRCSTLESSLDKLHEEIVIPNEKENTTIKKAFYDLENTWSNAFYCLRKYCGCDEYTIDLLYSFLQDTLIGKIKSTQKISKIFIVLDIIRESMEPECWYTMNDMFNMTKKNYTEYSDILKRENMGVLMTLYVEEGYFEEKREGRRYRNGQARYFKKTDKEYLDFSV